MIFSYYVSLTAHVYYFHEYRQRISDEYKKTNASRGRHKRREKFQRCAIVQSLKEYVA